MFPTPTPTAPAISRMEVLEYPCCPNRCSATANMRPRMSSLSTCINNERRFRLYFAKVRGLNLLDNTYLW